MPFSNYSELAASINDYLSRGDLTAQIPDFIALAEETINHRLRQAGRTATATVTTDALGVGTLPTDFREMKAVAITSPYRSSLTFITAREAANTDTLAGTPAHVLLSGRQLTIFPSGAASLTITYLQKVPPLTAVTPTNWLLTESPKSYLYGALMEAQSFLQNDTRLAVWKAQFDIAVDELITSEAASQWTQGTMRILSPTP